MSACGLQPASCIGPSNVRPILWERVTYMMWKFLPIAHICDCVGVFRPKMMSSLDSSAAWGLMGVFRPSKPSFGVGVFLCERPKPGDDLPFNVEVISSSSSSKLVGVFLPSRFSMSWVRSVSPRPGCHVELEAWSPRRFADAGRFWFRRVPNCKSALLEWKNPD